MADSVGDWVIWTQGVSKEFGGLRAVEDLNLRVRRGRVYGFVGPNGSGKTTAISMILGLVRPSRGVIRVLGHVPGSAGFRRALSRVGSLVQAPAFYPHLSGRDNLRVLGSAAGPVSDREVDRALDRVGLLDRASDRYSTYSLGMRQRLAIALALLGDPELIILDEPTNGLDPVGILEVRALLRELGREGRSVFLSSHLLHEVEQVCDDVGVIVQGKLVAQGEVGRLLGRRGLRLRVVQALEPAGSADGRLAGGPGSGLWADGNGHAGRLGEPAPLAVPPAVANGRSVLEKAARVLASLPGGPAVEVRQDGLWVDLPEERAWEATRALSRAGLWVCEMVCERSSLEEYFCQVAGLRAGHGGNGWNAGQRAVPGRWSGNGARYGATGAGSAGWGTAEGGNGAAAGGQAGR